MGIVSYAQNFEDVLLNRVFGSVHYAFYVDIGAYNPVVDSVTKSFYDRGWDGINIEPGDIFDQLAAARPRDINLHMAVYDHAGTISFVQHAGWYAGLSHVKGETETAEALSAQTGTEICTVPCDTLTNILARFGSQRPIAFLKIDAEGSEEAIIRSTDWRAIRPTVILVEATKPRSTVLDNHRWEPVLLDHGYQRAYFDGINCFYVPEERADLLRHFEMPVNILDGFQRFDPQLAELRTQAETSATRIRALETDLDRQNAQQDQDNAQRAALADENGVLRRELRETRDGLEASIHHVETLAAAQKAAVAAVVEANGHHLADLRSQLADAGAQLADVRHHRAGESEQLAGLHRQLAELQSRCESVTWERDTLRGMQGQAAQLRRLIRELQWPDGPTALRAVLPLARMLRLVARTKAPPIPPEELPLLAPGGATPTMRKHGSEHRHSAPGATVDRQARGASGLPALPTVWPSAGHAPACVPDHANSL